MSGSRSQQALGTVGASVVLALLALGCDLERGEFGAHDSSGTVVAAETPPVGGGAFAQVAAPPAGADPAKPGDGKRTNRLARETSPYLLLHAHNPVDWYPWGPEAFEAAKAQNKPIFLSVGYSSCYWCHVMERLVFSDAKIAAAMNEKFVNVKVDREERPDVDDIYMTSLLVYFQLLGTPQGGGWPLSMFLTPEGKPFAGGTYFPPKDENGRLGFGTVAERVATLWKEKPDDIKNNAELLTRETQRVMKPKLSLDPPKIDRDLVRIGVKALVESYDPLHGGVDFDPGDADSARFPVPGKLALLQYEVRRQGDKDAEKIVAHTLERLYLGGIHDHLGGGFHRYSVDREWHVPHFEKMLYDQAQLADAYVEAFRISNRPLDRDAADDVLTFVLRRMTSKDGAFHSAIDAETNGIEGAYYVWTKAEIEQALGAEDAAIFVKAYGLDQPQVFEHGYVLRRAISPEELAKALNQDRDVLERRLAGLRKKLLEVRDRRKSPLEDDKILTSWNGLMIRAFARASAVLGRDEYRQAAERAALFVLASMRDDKGRLYRTHRGKEAKLNAYLDDYAFLVDGLLALHDVTRDERWLNAARRLTDAQIELFWDQAGRGFYFTPHHHEALIARTKNAHDSVLPSGNAVAVRNLVRLAILTGDDRYRRHARETIEVFAPDIVRAPRTTTALAHAIGEYLDDPEVQTPGAANPERRDDGAGTFPNRDPGATTADATDADLFGTGIVRTADERIAATTDDPKPGQEKPLVKARAYLSVDKLPPGGTCRIVIFVDVEPGWHINANPAQPDFLIATEFDVKSTQGVKASGLVYPKGQTMKVKDIDEPVSIYEKQVVIRGVLEVPADAAGRLDEMELRVRYQPCNDLKCLKPAVATLKGNVPIARTLAEVKPINQNLFRPEARP